nr:immunoglobulin heavy chain junction region [Macaca mulatta]MOV42363.1 immunoglobulin heavy chain junction region [Macaca mulatta]MOV44500.1 immunoglobulin heavy chain junction region [Macaca mulatta]
CTRDLGYMNYVAFDYW